MVLKLVWQKGIQLLIKSPRYLGLPMWSSRCYWETARQRVQIFKFMKKALEEGYWGCKCVPAVPAQNICLWKQPLLLLTLKFKEWFSFLSFKLIQIDGWTYATIINVWSNEDCNLLTYNLTCQDISGFQCGTPNVTEKQPLLRESTSLLFLPEKKSASSWNTHFRGRLCAQPKDF